MRDSTELEWAEYGDYPITVNSEGERVVDNNSEFSSICG